MKKIKSDIETEHILLQKVIEEKEAIFEKTRTELHQLMEKFKLTVGQDKANYFLLTEKNMNQNFILLKTIRDNIFTDIITINQNLKNIRKMEIDNNALFEHNGKLHQQYLHYCNIYQSTYDPNETITSEKLAFPNEVYNNAARNNKNFSKEHENVYQLKVDLDSTLSINNKQIEDNCRNINFLEEESNTIQQRIQRLIREFDSQLLIIEHNLDYLNKNTVMPYMDQFKAKYGNPSDIANLIPNKSNHKPVLYRKATVGNLSRELYFKDESFMENASQNNLSNDLD